MQSNNEDFEKQFIEFVYDNYNKVENKKDFLHLIFTIMYLKTNTRNREYLITKAIKPEILFCSQLKAQSKLKIVFYNDLKWENYITKLDTINSNKIYALFDEIIENIVKLNPHINGLLFNRLEDFSKEFNSLNLFIKGLNDNLNKIDSKNALYRACKNLIENVFSKDLNNSGSNLLACLFLKLFNNKGGRILDPCCGIGENFLYISHNYNQIKWTFYGQEKTKINCKIAKILGYLNNYEVKLGKEEYSCIEYDDNKLLKADFVLINSSIENKDSLSNIEPNDIWYKYGNPSLDNNNYIFLLYAISHLNPDGKALVMLPTDSTNTSNENDFFIRKNLIEENKVDCIINIGEIAGYDGNKSQSIWILNNNKNNKLERIREKEILFIDYSKMINNETKFKKIFQNYDCFRKTGLNSDELEKLYEKAENYTIENTDKIKVQNYSLLPSVYLEKEIIKFGNLVGAQKDELIKGEKYTSKSKVELSEIKNSVNEIRTVGGDLDDNHKYITNSQNLLSKKY